MKSHDNQNETVSARPLPVLGATSAPSFSPGAGAAVASEKANMNTLADQIREHKATHPTVKQNFPSPYGKVFQSIDPLWRKWGVMREKSTTLWFNRKSDAESYLKTGDESMAVS